MKVTAFKILSNRALAPGVYDLRLAGDASDMKRPGQFVQVQLPSFYLRRPLSVADFSWDSLRLIYKVVGQGTLALSQMKEGELSLITGLGNGYRLPNKKPSTFILVGGGSGIPPLFSLSQFLLSQGFQPLVFLGFNHTEEAFLEEEFRGIGCRVQLASLDGSVGFRGNAVQALADLETDSPYIYSCGPLPMLRALNELMDERGWEGQFSMEERMGCGFGACMGCSIPSRKGPKRVCLDGPVFDRKDLLW